MYFRLSAEQQHLRGAAGTLAALFGAVEDAPTVKVLSPTVDGGVTKHSIVPVRPDQHHLVTGGGSLKTAMKRNLALRLAPKDVQARYNSDGASESFYDALMPAVAADDVAGKCMRRATSGKAELAVFQNDWGMLDRLTDGHWIAVHALFAAGEGGVPAFNAAATAWNEHDFNNELLPEAIPDYEAGEDSFKQAAEKAYKALRKEAIAYTTPYNTLGVGRDPKSTKDDAHLIRGRFLQKSALLLKKALVQLQAGTLSPEAVLLVMQALTVAREAQPAVLKARHAEAVSGISWSSWSESPEVSGTIHSSEAMNKWFMYVDTARVHQQHATSPANPDIQPIWQQLRDLKLQLVKEGSAEYAGVDLSQFLPLLDHVMQKVLDADSAGAAKQVVTDAFKFFKKPSTKSIMSTNHIVAAVNAIVDADATKASWWGKKEWLHVERTLNEVAFDKMLADASQHENLAMGQSMAEWKALLKTNDKSSVCGLKPQRAQEKITARRAQFEGIAGIDEVADLHTQFGHFRDLLAVCAGEQGEALGLNVDALSGWYAEAVGKLNAWVRESNVALGQAELVAAVTPAITEAQAFLAGKPLEALLECANSLVQRQGQGVDVGGSVTAFNELFTNPDLNAEAVNAVRDAIPTAPQAEPAL